jgi:flagellar biosynthesis/type III secretory pathway chaperone
MTVCQLCDQWVEQLQVFLLTLESEFDALKSNQAELITQVAERKLSQLDEIAQTERTLQLSVPDMQTDLLSYLLEHCSESASTARLLALTKEIQQANQRNGMLLQGLMRLNEFGLNLISGKIDTANTYSASGQVNSSTPISSIKLATA